MDFNEDPKIVMEDSEGNIHTMGCAIFWKSCRIIDTTNMMAFLDVPILVEKVVVQNDIDRVLQPLERKLIVGNPKHFPKNWHSKKDWVNYAIVKEFLGGMPWEDIPAGGKKENNGRMTFILCATGGNKRTKPLATCFWGDSIHSEDW